MNKSEELDLRDFSDKRECYYPCPKCGKNKLGFGSSLDIFKYLTEHKLEYYSSISCLSCLFRLVMSEQQAKEKKISVHELNRRQWNELYRKSKQNQQ